MHSQLVDMAVKPANSRPVSQGVINPTTRHNHTSLGESCICIPVLAAHLLTPVAIRLATIVRAIVQLLPFPRLAA